MSVAQPYLTPAATPDNMMASPAGPQAVQQPAAGSQEQLRADIERMLLKVSQDLYELEVCAGDVAQGQEDRVPMYM
jgi:mediator of RNA polymerase II transcription subunit 10